MRGFSGIVVGKAPAEVFRGAGIVLRRICLAAQDVNIPHVPPAQVERGQVSDFAWEFQPRFADRLRGARFTFLVAWLRHAKLKAKRGARRGLETVLSY
ncbi:MAG: hypothetical protein KGL97_07625 [Alphaproteobacteria bacterium]|nr:hypothetical protein [Alphaproteobacteria bacterium]